MLSLSPEPPKLGCMVSGLGSIKWPKYLAILLWGGGGGFLILLIVSMVYYIEPYSND